MEQTKTLLPKLLAVLVAIVLVFALFNIIKAFMPAPIPTTMEDLNYGLSTDLYDEDPDVDVTDTYSGDLVGSLYFDSIALPEDGEDVQIEGELAPNLYRYDFTEKAIISLVLYGATYDGNPLNENEIAFVSAVSDTAKSNKMAHILLNTSSGTYRELTEKEGVGAYALAVSPNDPNRVVYVFKAENLADTPDLSNYELVLVNPYIDKSVVIEGAASPTWLPGDDAIVFIKKDGVYMYDLKTDTHSLLTDVYTNLDVYNNIAISPDGLSAVLSVPSENALAIFESITTDEGVITGIEETGYISTPGVIFKTPVFSPDSRFYAVVAAMDNGTTLDHTIEIRHILSREVVETIEPEGTDSQFLYLSAWSGTAVQGLSEVTEFSDPEL